MKIKSSELPTHAQMKAFAAKWTPEQWETICKSKTFCHALPESIEAAHVLAIKILAGTWKEPE